MDNDTKKFLAIVEALAWLSKLQHGHPTNCGCKDCIVIKLSIPVTLSL